MKTDDFIIMPIPTQNYAAVCALIGVLNGVSLPTPGNAGQPKDSYLGKSNVADQSATSSNSTTEASGNQSGSSESGEAEQTSDTTSSADDSGEIDAHGHRWSADLHASTKGKTKEGLWRMKPGASRPDPLPGFPVDGGTDTGTSPATDTPSATSPAATEPASAPPATSPAAGEDDEFAAFRAAAVTSGQTDAAAAASVPPRTYSDADLGALCNQAATKLGDPSPIKEIIASYTPEGQVAHSRNIPEDKRAAFVGEVETKAGISFAG